MSTGLLDDTGSATMLASLHVIGAHSLTVVTGGGVLHRAVKSGVLVQVVAWRALGG